MRIVGKYRRSLVPEGFFFQAEDGIRDADVTGVQTCALPISEVSRGLTTLVDLSAARRTLASPSSLSLPQSPFEAASAQAEIGRASCRERVESSVVSVGRYKKGRGWVRGKIVRRGVGKSIHEH